MDGVLIIDKPEGFTSHDVVSRLRRILNTKKIGHTGTLDPFATGVLVMLVGKATRLARFLDKDEKEYEAKLKFGFETDTGDRTGSPRKPNEVSLDRELPITNDQILAVLPDFIGEIEQMPPMYSAKKVDGKKLYELARKGIEIERKPVKVVISELRITNRELLEADQELTIQVSCSAGTYIRTLAEDIGHKIGVGCHLNELRRVRAGKFNLSKAISLEELEEKVLANELDKNLISMNKAVSHLPEKKLDEDELKRIRNGMKVAASFAAESVQNVRLTDAGENLIAIGEYEKNSQEIQPRIVFQDQQFEE